MKKKIKRKINIKGLLFILLLIYLIFFIIHYFINLPIKNIYIKGTNLLKDNDIIEVLGIKKYPSILKLNTNSLEKKLKKLELVEDVKITKKLNGKLLIDVSEAIPLYYNRTTNKVMLSTNKEVDNNYIGIPVFINKATKDIINSFNDHFKDIDSDIIKMINEIKYDPDIVGDIIIDKDRFLLSMNDGNLVYVNILNLSRLNNYKKIYTALTDKGTLYLDSYDSGNVYGLFTPYANSINNGDDLDDGGES